MAIITFSRQVAAHGDEIGAEVAKILGFKFIKRTDIEKRIIELGFPEDKMPKYDERKPSFINSMKKDRDIYINLTQYAMLEAASSDNAVFIGRGAFALFKNVKNAFSVRLVADDETRIKRLMDEFNWKENQARSRINESDTNRDGFHKNFYNVDVDEPTNFDMVLNTSLMSDQDCVKLISEYKKIKIEKKIDKEGNLQIQDMFKAQSIINKLMFEYKLKIEFMHAEIHNNVFTLYGVSDSPVVVEQALKIIKTELPVYEIKSSVSIVQDFKTYQ